MRQITVNVPTQEINLDDVIALFDLFCEVHQIEQQPHYHRFLESRGFEHLTDNKFLQYRFGDGQFFMEPNGRMSTKIWGYSPSESKKTDDEFERRVIEYFSQRVIGYT